MIPILVAESSGSQLCRNIEAINQGLAYTIHRFSSHFQKMHETCLKDYARRLEKDVAARTAELKESEQQYRRLVEEIQDGYLVLSKEKIEYVNPAFCRLHGVTPYQALQQPFLTFVAAENRDRVRQIITGEPLRTPRILSGQKPLNTSAEPVTAPACPRKSMSDHPGSRAGPITCVLSGTSPGGWRWKKRAGKWSAWPISGI